jgi:hypothetical protein
MDFTLFEEMTLYQRLWGVFYISFRTILITFNQVRDRRFYRLIIFWSACHFGRRFFAFSINTGGWREILADGGKYLRIAENTGGWREILADRKK